MTMPRELGHGRSTGGRTAVVAEESRIATAYARRVHNARYTWSDPAHVLSMQERVRAVLGLLRQHARAGLSEQRILEVGCGAGQWLRDFLKWVATPHRVVGIDLVQTRTEAARTLCPADASITCGSAGTLPFQDGAFDIVLQSTVFTSTLDAPLRASIAREMRRAAAPDALIIWYDRRFDNPWNPDGRGVAAAELKELFAGRRMELRSITLAPPVARAVAPIADVLYSALSTLPFLRSHFRAAIWHGG